MIFYDILSTNSLRKCLEISLENLYVDIGACRVNCFTFTVSYCFKTTVKPRFIKGQPLNMDNSLLQTVCFVPGEKISPYIFL